MEPTQNRFSRWLDRFLDSYYRHRPVNATYIGVHDYDHRLPDLSESGVDACVSEMTQLQKDLAALPPEPCRKPRRWTDDWPGFLEIQQWEFQSTHFHRGNPSFYAGEAIFGVLSLFRRPFAPFDQRLQAATERMNGIEVLLQQARENIETAPSAWTERAIGECDGALAFLETGLSQLLRDNDVESNEADDAAGRAADAFRQFKHWLQSDLAQRPNDAYGCGEAAFNLMLQKGHCLDMDAADVEAYAWEQMQESQEKLEAHAADFGASDWREALAKLGKTTTRPWTTTSPTTTACGGPAAPWRSRTTSSPGPNAPSSSSPGPNGHGALRLISTSSPTIPPQPSTKSPQSTACWPPSSGAPPQRSACGCSKPPTTASSS